MAVVSSGDEASAGEDELAAAKANSFTMRRLLRQPSQTSSELPGGRYEMCRWWSQCVRDATATRWDELDTKFKIRSCPLFMDSFCSGFCTEVLAAEAVGIPLDQNISASEKKPVAREFIIENMKCVKHLSGTLKEQSSEKAYCSVHCQDCPTSKGSGRVCDLLAGGTPCQPFTCLNTEDVVDHDLYNTTFGDPTKSGDPEDSLYSLVDKLRPNAVLLEQVEGFGNNHESLGQRPISAFLSKLMMLKDEAGNSHFVAARVFPLNSNIFVNVDRPRSSVQHRVIESRGFLN